MFFLNSLKWNRISNLDLVKRIIRIFNKNYRKIKKQKKLIRYVSDRPGHDFKYSINSNKFRKELKWKPKYNMTEGIKNTIRWYLKNRKWLSYCYKKYKGQRLGKI